MNYDVMPPRASVFAITLPCKQKLRHLMQAYLDQDTGRNSGCTMATAEAGVLVITWGEPVTQYLSTPQILLSRSSDFRELQPNVRTNRHSHPNCYETQ